MADSKISELEPLVHIADADEFVTVDKDDLTQAPSGSTKKVSAIDIQTYISPFTDAKLLIHINDESPFPALTNHIIDTTPHPSYDDVESLVGLFETGII